MGSSVYQRFKEASLHQARFKQAIQQPQQTSRPAAGSLELAYAQSDVISKTEIPEMSLPPIIPPQGPPVLSPLEAIKMEYDNSGGPTPERKPDQPNPNGMPSLETFVGSEAISPRDENSIEKENPAFLPVSLDAPHPLESPKVAEGSEIVSLGTGPPSVSKDSSSST